MDFENPLWFSVYETRRGRMAPVKERDVYWCAKCRHGWRRVFLLRPTRWEAYATAGTVRPEGMCPSCRKRLKALNLNREPVEVGTRVVGVDA